MVRTDDDDELKLRNYDGHERRWVWELRWTREKVCVSWFVLERRWVLFRKREKVGFIDRDD